MKTIKLFAALCVIAALGVSCRKEVPVQNEEEQIVVPEGMEYVSFEVGVPTKINGNVKWNTAEEDISVIALVNGESTVYKFQTEKTSGVAETKKISGVVDTGANLKFVVYPYYSSTKIDLEKDPSGNTLLFPSKNPVGYSNADGVSSQTPFACKIKYEGGVFSAASPLQPLYSSLKVTLPSRLKDFIPGYKDSAQPTSLVDSLYITGKGVLGQTYVDFNGESPVTTLKNAPSKQTLKVALKTNTSSGLPTAGYYYVPITPCSPETLEITLTHKAGSDGIEYADYTFHFGANTFEQGKAKEVTLTAPYVKSAATVSAALDGTTLLLSGSSEFFTGTKVTADNYKFGFDYRAKGATDWETAEAVYDKGQFTADVTVAAGTTYEVKAFAVAPNAIKKEIAPEQYINVDMKVEGAVIDSKGYVPPIVVSIDHFLDKEYDGTASGGYWETDGDFDFPLSKEAGRGTNVDKYKYYANPTDATPLTSVIVKGSGSNSYYFQKAALMHYGGNGYIEFPGKEGYKIVQVETRGKANGAVGNKLKVMNKDVTSASSTTGLLGTSETYAVAGEEQVLTVNLAAPVGEPVRIFFAAFPYEYFKITYSAN